MTKPMLNGRRSFGSVARAMLSCVALTLGMTSVALAQAAGTDAEGWKFTVAPYLMMPWMNGPTTVRGNEVKVDVSPSDILSNLQIGAMGYFEARKGKWAVGADAVYMALGTTVQRTPIFGDRANADVDFNQGAYTFTAMREASANVDFLFGARWNVLTGRLGFKGPNQTVVKDTKQWADPIVGLKFKQKLGSRLHFSMQADVGGFNAGARYAWHVFPVIGTDVGKRATLGLGYRVIGMNYHNGTGDKLFVYNVITQGLVLGAAFHF